MIKRAYFFGLRAVLNALEWGIIMAAYYIARHNKDDTSIAFMREGGINSVVPAFAVFYIIPFLRIYYIAYPRKAHFSVSSTESVASLAISTFVAWNIAVNGLYHRTDMPFAA